MQLDSYVYAGTEGEFDAGKTKKREKIVLYIALVEAAAEGDNAYNCILRLRSSWAQLFL